METIKFESPSTWVVSGMTGSGKTFWLYKLLQNKDIMFVSPPNNIRYCYSVWQNVFDDMENELNVTFLEGLPSVEHIKDIFDGKHNLIYLDDLQHEVSNNKEIEKLFTQLSHHNNLSVIYINQNLYYQGKCARTMNLNTAYTVMLKNPRNIQQAALLGMQIGMRKVLKEAYQDVNKKQYGYLIVDLSPKSNEKYRLRTNVFPDELPVIVYQ